MPQRCGRLGKAFWAENTFSMRIFCAVLTIGVLLLCQPATLAQQARDELLTGVQFLKLGDDADALPRWGEQTEHVPERVVLLIHGLDEPGSIWDTLAPALAHAGYSTARFVYPNDGPIAASAELLIEHLTILAEQGVQQVDLVCHSMGGLVARDALTRAGVDRAALPQIQRLIMLGTPNQGSALATARGIAELREQLVRFIDDREQSSLMRFSRDGQGQAGRDLMPGSAYLLELNARELPVDVHITIVAGVAVPVDEKDVKDKIRSSILGKVLGADLSDRITDQVVKLSAGLGDGVVPVDSAQLAGVDDVITVQANHRSMVTHLGTDDLLWGVGIAGLGVAGEPPAIPIVLNRLRQEPTSSGG